MLNLIDFSGRKIVVAGASSGIGQGTAVLLSRLGATLSLVARREDKLAETLSQLEGEGHRYYGADLSQLDGIEGLVKRIVEDNGPLDGLIYAAGVGTALPLAQAKPEKIQSVLNINYLAFVETVRQMTRRGHFNPGMRIVGVSSVASLFGERGHTAYSASKAAMDASVRCIAKELKSKEICINTVAPSWVKTRLFEAYLERVDEQSASYHSALERQYLGVVDVQAVSNLIAFLLSPAARFITGSCIPVDGGYTSN